MLFNSLQFLIYFPIVVLLYYVIPDRIKYVWLLIASYYFYMCWNAKYALLIFASSIITYISGIGLEKLQQLDAEPKRIITYKKLTLASGFIINLLILFYFKYSNFIINIIDSIFKVAKVDINIPMFDIILPVGISFYIFRH